MGVLGGHLQVVNLLLLQLFDLLVVGPQFFRLAVVALILVAAHAAALLEQELALADRLASVAADQHHVTGVAVLAARFYVLLGKQRPQPVLVRAVRLHHAGGGPAVALVAGAATELLRIMNVEQFHIRMADKRARVLVWLLSRRRHVRRGQLQRFADAQVAGLAAVHHDGVAAVARVGYDDLVNGRRQVLHLVLQPGHLRRGQRDHVVGDVLLHFRVDGGDRFEHITQLAVGGGALVFQPVVFRFQLLVVVLLPAAIGEYHREQLLLPFLQVALPAALGRRVGVGLNLIGNGAHVSALVGENALHRQNLRAQIADALVQLRDLRLGLRGRLLVLLCQFLVLGAGLHVLLRFTRLRPSRLQERGIALLEHFLIALPWPLPVGLVPQRPEHGGHEHGGGNRVIQRVRLTGYRIIVRRG